MILEARRRGDIKGIKVVVNLSISHLLFIDDLLLFSDGSRRETHQLKKIIDLFLKATRMCINIKKSSLIVEGFTRAEIRMISKDIPFEDNFKYLGFHLKLDTYMI